jgi:hypothetical protein
VPSGRGGEADGGVVSGCGVCGCLVMDEWSWVRKKSGLSE